MKRLMIGFGVLALFLLALPRDGVAQTTVKGKFQYAVKYVCGPTTVPGGGPVTGHYSTHVNIHNPVGDTTFALKVAHGFTNSGPPFPPPFSDYQALIYIEDQAGTVKCNDIKFQLGAVAGFYEGFLVIVTPKELDVTAVYTAEVSQGSGVQG